MNHDLAQQGQLRLHLIPDPAREVFAGWIFQALDFVEIVMIEPVESRLECRAHVGEIHHPACLRIHRSGDMQLDAKRMAVQARALVASRHVGQTVRRLDRENAENVQAAFFRRELLTQLQVPQVQRMATHALQTVKSTEPK